MARPRGSLEKLGALVPRVYPSREPEELATARAFGFWSRVVSRRVLETARPVRLRHGTLTIHTATAAHADAMQYEAEHLLLKLQALAPEARIRTLRFQVGALPDLPSPALVRGARKAIAPAQRLPENVAAALASIPNAEVREAVAHAASTAIAREDFDARSAGRRRS